MMIKASVLQKIAAFLAVCAALAVTACAPWRSVTKTGFDWSTRAGNPLEKAECSLASARTLAVVLQDADFDEIRAADPDVLVIDYSKSGGECGELTKEDVDALRKRPEGSVPSSRIILAYMSIGEAESYRYYWPESEDGQCKPGYVVEINPDWDENYRVEYWNPEWRDVLAGKPDSYLTRILDQGFDGVFLDTVDTAEVYVERGTADAPAKMLDLVRFIAATARAKNPAFLVVAQNPYVILDLEGAMDVISGISAENVLLSDGYMKPAAEMVPVLEKLNQVKNAGRSVLSIEYTDDPIQMSIYQDLCLSLGYLCYKGVRALNHLEPLIPSGNEAVCR